MAEEKDKQSAESESEQSDEAAPEAKSDEPTAEELEGQTGAPDGADDSKPFDDSADKMANEAEPLLEGDTISSPAGPLPARSLTAIAAFLVVFVVVFFVLWALLGGIGLLLGIVSGAALGLGAMKLVADRSRA